MMDRRLQRAPDAEWVLMYRLGLNRKHIAELVHVHPAVIGYHLVIARRQDPELEAAHDAAADARTSPSPADLARMDEVIAWVSAEGQLPDRRSPDRYERSMARWLSGRRREAAEGTLDPAYSPGLAQVPGWAESRRETADETRWHDRLSGLVDFRQEGHDWPRHHDYETEREHTLGVWLHAQRYKRRRGDLDPVKAKLLDDALPGWQTGEDPEPSSPAVTGKPSGVATGPTHRQQTPFRTGDDIGRARHRGGQAAISNSALRTFTLRRNPLSTQWVLESNSD